MSSSGSSNVFPEIQGLRGIAIVCVFLFHLWPRVFPNGYVGVDMFFVISGYLMAKILTKHQFLSLKLIVEFYYKRARRILPLYYLAIPLIFLASDLFIGIAWLHENNLYALFSLAFLKNMQIIWDGKDYFRAFKSSIRQKDIFLHLWSLAVEIQFYLIVPFIFLILQFLKTISHRRQKELKVAFLFILCTISCEIYYTSNPIFSFNFTLARLWQFGMGMIAFIAFENFADNPSKVIFAFIMVIAMFLPQEIPDVIMRPATTLACFCFLLGKTQYSKQILTHKALTFCGDISYSLYIIHWPVILLFDHKMPVQFVIGITLLLSVISYTFYENFYRNLTQPKFLLLLGGLALLNVWVFLALFKCPVISKQIDNYYYRKASPNVREALQFNVEFARNPALRPSAKWNISSPSIHPAFPNIPVPVWGIWDYPRGNGTQKVAVMGNSYSVNQMELINIEFNRNYSQFKSVSGLGLQGLYDFWALHPPSLYSGQHQAAFQILEEFRPDVLFIVTRFDENFPPLVGNLSDDHYLQLINKNLKRLEEFCGKVLIHGPTPLAPMVHLNNFIDVLSEEEDLTKFHLDKNDVDEQMKNYFPRLDALNCSRCEVYDIRSAFFDGNKYLTYDSRSNLSYFDNDIHFTLAGLETIRAIYTKLISNL